MRKNQYEVVPSGELSIVVSADRGRQVTAPQPFALSKLTADNLNRAAAAGSKAHARALGALEDWRPEPIYATWDV